MHGKDDAGKLYRKDWKDIVNLSGMYIDFKERIKPRYGFKTALDFWNELKEVLPASTYTVDKRVAKPNSNEDVTVTEIMFPTIRECRQHFAKIIPGIECTWKLKTSRLFEDNRLPLETKLEDFKCPWPTNFYGSNIKQFMEDRNYPVVKEDEWVHVDKEATIPRSTYNLSSIYSNF